MTFEYRIGDVRDRLAEIPDGTIDLIVTSPPFLALRSYLPADHPDKHREIGSEATPADFLDTLLGLSAEWGRVLAPHGSLCVELGDTYSGSGGAGGDYAANGLRGDAPKFAGSAKAGRLANYTDDRGNPDGMRDTTFSGGNTRTGGGNGWPLAKSLTGIPTLYPWSLAYGRNLLTGQPSPAGQWRIRNLIVWARPNPPVGALGDKFRPATSYITVACKSAKRYFDLDAVRTTPTQDPATYSGNGYSKGSPMGIVGNEAMPGNPAGAPPLDWHADHHPEDGDWLWKLPTQPYAGSHYATFPMALPKRLIEAMCPLRVCTVCGRPSERIVGDAEYVPSATYRGGLIAADAATNAARSDRHDDRRQEASLIRSSPTTGWSDCGCEMPAWSSQRNHWRTGIVLDPFAGSGTTLEAAQAVGRHAIGIDLDSRNVTLASERVGMFMEVSEDARTKADAPGDPILDLRYERGA